MTSPQENENPQSSQKEPINFQPAKKQTNTEVRNPLDPILLNRFIENQTLELQIRKGEQEIRQKELSFNYEFSNKALDAEASDREKVRDHDRKKTQYYLWFGIAVIFALTVFMMTALLKDKDAIAKEILDTMIKLSIGGVGGFAWARNSLKKEEEPKSQNPSE